MMIHRWWSGPAAPPDEERIRAAVLETHPGHELIDHAFEFPDDGLVAEEARFRHAANVIRLQLLHEHGGMWLDYDVTPFTDLTSVHANPWTPVVGGRFRQSCVMFFPEPGHPWLKMALDIIATRKPSNDPAYLVSGVRMLNDLPDLDVGRERRVIPADRSGNHQMLRDPVLATYLTEFG